MGMWENQKICQNRCIACQVLEEMAKTAPEEIQQQMQDIQWIKVQENKLVVGSQARILYADAEGRVKLPKHLIRLLPKVK
jgi:urocanate hydratase